MHINDVLKSAVQSGASDIHLSSGDRIWCRVDGELQAITQRPISAKETEALIGAILSESEKAELKDKLNLDKSYFIDGLGNFRVNVFYTRRGIGAVIRALPSRIPTIEELALPPAVKALAHLPKGLILVTGPTGSGKSTTLAAIVNYLNENFAYHILTIEDPVEFIHTSKKALVNQREIGHSCPSFAAALKYAMREDPDVILIGEMRDLETISLALTAAETGHLVLGTLHTRGAASTIDRIIETFPAEQQEMARGMLADSLQAVLSQTLVKRAEGAGRVAVHELMVMNWAISNLVREGKTFQIPSIIQTAKKEGMILMEAHARELMASNTISAEDAEALIGAQNRTVTTAPPTPAVVTAPPLKAAAPKAVAPKPPKLELEQDEIEVLGLEMESTYTAPKPPPKPSEPATVSSPKNPARPLPLPTKKTG